MLNEKGFDRWAEDYDADVARSDGEGSYPFAGYQRVLDAIARRVLERGTPRVLDLGFGTGTLTERLYWAGCQVFGQDFSPEMLSAARRKMPEAQLFPGDLSHGLAPELAGQDYDCIVATHLLPPSSRGRGEGPLPAGAAGASAARRGHPHRGCGLCHPGGARGLPGCGRGELG